MILNDEYGLQSREVAVAIAIAFKEEWPLLICAPSVLVYTWQEVFVKLIPNFDLTKIGLVHGGEAEFPQTTITVVSY